MTSLYWDGPQGFTNSKIFTCPTSKIYIFFYQPISNLWENFGKIHLPDWLFACNHQAIWTVKTLLEQITVKFECNQLISFMSEWLRLMAFWRLQTSRLQGPPSSYKPCNHNLYIHWNHYLHENEFEKFICNISTIFSGPQYAVGLNCLTHNMSIWNDIEMQLAQCINMWMKILFVKLSPQ